VSAGRDSPRLLPSLLLLLGAASCGSQSSELFLRATDAGPAPICVALSRGDGGECVQSVTWLERARAACAAEGLALLDWSPSEPCEGGGYRRTSFTCCPPLLAGCRRQELTKDNCLPPEVWAQYSEGACEAEGMVLFGETFSEACGPDSFGTYRYYCCP
jgi:hypothetical protein